MIDFELNDEASLMSRHCLAVTSIQPTFFVFHLVPSLAIMPRTTLSLANWQCFQTVTKKRNACRKRMAAYHNAQPLPTRVNIQVSHMRQENVNSRFAVSIEHGAKQRGGTHCLSRRRFIASA
jgi:hypothetical protein